MTICSLVGLITSTAHCPHAVNKHSPRRTRTHKYTHLTDRTPMVSSGKSKHFCCGNWKVYFFLIFGFTPKEVGRERKSRRRRKMKVKRGRREAESRRGKKTLRKGMTEEESSCPNYLWKKMPFSFAFSFHSNCIVPPACSPLSFSLAF